MASSSFYNSKCDMPRSIYNIKSAAEEPQQAIGSYQIFNTYESGESLISAAEFPLYYQGEVTMDLNSMQSKCTDVITEPCSDVRETGVIFKLLHSYGFIQCCDRQGRLFFHFSQFTGNLDELVVGDPVEFKVSYDHRTCKPIACQVALRAIGRLTGTIVIEIPNDNAKNTASAYAKMGRISYENRGEYFFLPFSKCDVQEGAHLRLGDIVSFQIVTSRRGNIRACQVRIEKDPQPIKYLGVVRAIKNSFGFVERVDIKKQLFFHISEVKDNANLCVNDYVEFNIQTRNGDPIACNIARLPIEPEHTYI